MTRPSPPAALPLEHTAYTGGYERLRRHGVKSGTGRHHHGLAMLVLRGVAAWLHACAEASDPPAGVCGTARSEAAPEGVERPVLDIVLAMLEGHMGRGSA